MLSSHLLTTRQRDYFLIPDWTKQPVMIIDGAITSKMFGRRQLGGCQLQQLLSLWVVFVGCLPPCSMIYWIFLITCFCLCEDERYHNCSWMPAEKMRGEIVSFLVSVTMLLTETCVIRFPGCLVQLSSRLCLWPVPESAAHREIQPAGTSLFYMMFSKAVNNVCWMESDVTLWCLKPCMLSLQKCNVLVLAP